MDDDGPIVGNLPRPSVKSRSRRAARDSARPRPATEANEGEEPSLGLPQDFNRLSPRDQFLERRALYAKLTRHYQRLKPVHGNRPDLPAMKYMNDRGLSLDFQQFGPVPGVEVGDTFAFRSEVYVVGLHRQVQGGIAWIVDNGEKVACSVVVSGGYQDDVDRGEIIEYTGQGGNNYRGDKRQVEDQKPKLGNKSLINSCRRGTPVRVIRGHDVEVTTTWNKTYTYDGLYTVISHELREGKDGHKIYNFKLQRIPDQPPLHIERKERLKSLKTGMP